MPGLLFGRVPEKFWELLADRAVGPDPAAEIEGHRAARAAALREAPLGQHFDQPLVVLVSRGTVDFTTKDITWTPRVS